MKTFEFSRQTRSYPGFNFDKPTIIYQLLNQNDENLRIEFVFSIKAKIIINSKTYYVGPPEKGITFGKINILNENKELRGIIDYYGWIIQTKKLILFGHDNNLNEEWTIDENINIFKRKYWNNTSSDIEIESNEKVFKLKKEKNFNKSKSILDDDVKCIVKTTSSQPFNETYFMCGLIIYLLELKELEMCN